MPRTAKERRAENDRQAKVAAIRAAERRRRTRLQLVAGSVAMIVLVVLVLVAVKVASNGSQGGPATLAPTAVADRVANVPATVFAKVGLGSGASRPVAIKGSPISSGGLPEVLYVGAEYCPYCAAERWAVVAALGRFGTFRRLGQTSSTSHDVYPSTPTLSFHGSSYSSKYVAFHGYEQQDRNGKLLDTVPPAGLKLLQKYDAPPYVTSQNKNAIPFIYLDGKYLISGASFSPQVLHGMSHAQVAKAISNPSSAVSKSVIGAANLITAAVCASTNDKPAAVCTSNGVRAATAILHQ